MKTISLQQFKFFRDNAGYVVGSRAAGAVRLARAENWAKSSGLVFRWEADNQADFSFIETWEAKDQEAWNKGEHFAEICELIKPCECCGEGGETLASLGGIIDADSNYRRVIEAELALEVAPERPKIKNQIKVEFLDASELTAEELEDLYEPEEDKLFRFNGSVYQLGQFLRFKTPQENGFEAYFGLNYFHAVLLKLNSEGTGATVANCFS